MWEYHIIIERIWHTNLRKVWSIGRLRRRDFLLCLPTKTEESLLLGRLNGIRYKILIVLGAYETRIAILFQEQGKDVLASHVESETWGRLQALLNFLHRFAIDIDFTWRSRLQEFSAQIINKRGEKREENYLWARISSILCECSDKQFHSEIRILTRKSPLLSLRSASAMNVLNH